MGSVHSKMRSFFSNLRAVLLSCFLRRQLQVVKALRPKASRNSQLAAELKGQKIRVPNLDPMFEGWPMGNINPNYLKLLPFVNRKIDR
jgi:hypothetical protein